MLLLFDVNKNIFSLFISSLTPPIKRDLTYVRCPSSYGRIRNYIQNLYQWRKDPFTRSLYLIQDDIQGDSGGVTATYGAHF
jgi:hypothetical protein